MSELRLLIGLPASGKSTYAQRLRGIGEEIFQWEINWDTWRRDRGLHTKKFNRADEEKMQKDSMDFAEAMGEDGYNVLVDNTNLTESTRNRWKGVAERAGMTYTEVRMDTSLEECIRRDSLREGSARVGRAVIERMALFAGMIKFPINQRYIICDLDGTIADCSHRRRFIDGSLGFKNWDRFESECLLDPPHDKIIELVRMFHRDRYKILVVSGRQTGRGGIATEQWLYNNHVPYQHLFMRQSGDHRQDNIVKQEILDRLPKNQIDYILDDRNQVVDMWRANGLTCLQVAEGDF